MFYCFKERLSFYGINERTLSTNELVMISSSPLLDASIFTNLRSQRPQSPSMQPTNGSMTYVMCNDGIRACTSIGRETAGILQPIPCQSSPRWFSHCQMASLWTSLHRFIFHQSDRLCIDTADATKTRIRECWRAAGKTVGSDWIRRSFLSPSLALSFFRKSPYDPLSVSIAR